MPPIDWTKPLEHVDGTPLIFCPNYKNPDTAGDYFLVREDGEPLTRARKNGTVFGCLIVKPDGHGWGAYNTGAPIVRNRAQPRAEAPATTWGAPISGEVMRTLNLPPDTPVKYCTRAATAELLHFDGEGDYQLRANHPYYLATSQGFAYWPGGDGAPADWDGGPVLLENGRVPMNGLIDPATQWLPDTKDGWSRVIGYRRKVEAPAVEAPVVARNPRKARPIYPNGTRIFSEDHGLGWAIEAKGRTNCAVRFDGGRTIEFVGVAQESLYEVPEVLGRDVAVVKRMTEAEVDGWMRAHDWGLTTRSRDDVLSVLRDLGLIRKETLAERFTRETGHKVTPAVEAALQWGRAA